MLRYIPLFVVIIIQLLNLNKDLYSFSIEQNTFSVITYEKNKDVLEKPISQDNTIDTSTNTPTDKTEPSNPEDITNPSNETLHPSESSKDLATLDNTTINWWFGRNDTFSRPNGAMDIDKLRGYDAYYLGADNQTLYLTFDEGGNDVTYISEILDVLNNDNVKATFFLTKNFILNNADLVNKMVSSGHIVGSHSVTHPDFTTLSIDDMKNEILGVEEAYRSVTGQEITKVFRFPMGAFSEQTLGVLQSMGYKSYFWSFAYRDWEEDLDPSVALSWFETYYHNGAIYLIHPKNKGNYLALDTFIKDMKSKGYTFDLVTNIE